MVSFSVKPRPSVAKINQARPADHAAHGARGFMRIILENSAIHADEVLLVAWFFVIGAVIGSFLNVVAYRLPKRMSLIEPSSHCPGCKKRIRWRDNVPIISWFLLKGRCRDCGSAISVRYPLVEAITAGMFALLTVAEFTFRGINLPGREIYKNDGIILFAQNSLHQYGILLYHLLLLCTLFAAAIIEIDRQRAPWRLFVPALFVGIVAPLVWPHLRSMPAWALLPDFVSRIADVAGGLAAGGLLGYIGWRIGKTESPGGLSWGLLSAGVFLGWQAVCALALIMMLLTWMAMAFCKLKKNAKPWPAAVWLYAAALMLILAWSLLGDLTTSLVQ
ncbi:MAG TPA: prepilin peptidase [Thermoguttaceae bacterium]